jgi:ribosome recycling factor
MVRLNLQVFTVGHISRALSTPTADWPNFRKLLTNAERDSTKEQMESLEKQLQEANKKVKTTQKKQEIREGLLQDVIFHYKQLQKEHDKAITRITELEGMMSDGNPADDHDIRPRSSKKSKTDS